ncbi:MAG: MiaB/RimO family radical SAM methylthiotransferase [Bacteroidetes bacterium]|jgi:tRNA-2-methylthio-N6-dimethylallyladenosine synthase|nr:MiaB/RimO family radical SAM methylthiotransferase [Bacteroidota bacterium]
MKYHLISLGCQMNLSDTERVRTVMHSMGLSETEREEEASILGIIACSVRQKAIDKVYSRIYKWNKMKNRKSLLTFVSGCLLPSDKDRFLKLFDLVFTMSELTELPTMISQYGIVSPAGLQHLESERETLLPKEMPVNEKTDSLLKPVISDKNITSGLKLNPAIGIDGFWHVEPTYTSAFEAFIPIQNGCDKFCTFCAVPYTRGREVSRPSGEILEELQNLVEKGFKSITLLGQNVNSYGLDKKGEEIGFPELLRKIGEFGLQSGKEFWLYFTSPHPRDMTDEVIEVIAQYPVLAKQIHLPVQSGDDGVLLRMNRKHSMDKYRHIVQTIRRLLPQATLFTDIIVGFTGESDEQFENTRKAMEEFKYNMAYIAQYSVRPGAASSRWADDIPKEVKKERLHVLTQELMKYAHLYNMELVGKTFRVLVRGRDRKNGYLSALTEGKLVIRFASEKEELVGEFVDVKIISASPLSLEAAIIEVPILQTV